MLYSFFSRRHHKGDPRRMIYRCRAMLLCRIAALGLGLVLLAFSLPVTSAQTHRVKHGASTKKKPAASASPTASPEATETPSTAQPSSSPEASPAEQVQASPTPQPSPTDQPQASPTSAPSPTAQTSFFDRPLTSATPAGNTCSADDPNVVPRITSLGTGCNPAEAQANALTNAIHYCTADHDPRCQGGCTASDGPHKCRPGTMVSWKTKSEVRKINLRRCENGKGYEASLTGDVLCRCFCP